MSLDLKACSDGELAVLTLAGRHAAFAELVRRHQTAVYRLVRAHIGDPEEALDLAQDCFATAFTALGRYQPDRAFRPWVARIAINKCRDWIRRQKVRDFFTRALPLSNQIADAVPDSTPAIDVAYADREELERLWRAVALLPAALKEPLILCTVEGLSQVEVAQILAISEKAVETRIYRARAKLSEALAAAGDH